MDTRLRIPAAIALVAAAGQIIYPHTEGAARDLLTIATVALFATTSLLHVVLTRGGRAAWRVLGVLAGGGLLVEVLGVATGVPFGSYEYSSRLGPMVGDVPVVIPLAWLMLGWPAAVVAVTVVGQRAWPWFVAVGAVALTTWDLFLDPQMVSEGYWTWASGPGPDVLGGIPATNYLGWLAVSALMMVLLRPVLVRDAVSDDRIPLLVYGWTWLGSVVAHAFYFDLVPSAIAGGVGMGVVVALLAARLRRGAGTHGVLTRPIDRTASR